MKSGTATSKRRTSVLPSMPLEAQSITPTPYIWAEKKSDYDSRPASGWKDTFALQSSSRNSKRRDALFQYEERRRARIAETGWRNITIAVPEKPKMIDMEAVSALQEEEIGKKGAFLRNRGNYCFTCWLVVHCGPLRVSCCHCLAVTHKACIAKIEVEEEAIQWKPLGAKALPWTCPDCIEDVESNSHFQVLRQRQLYRESMEMFAILKVQAFARMVRYRIDFIFAKIGFTRLQQLFHARKAWTALKSYEEKRPRPFRIRVNDVKLFVRSPDAAEEESVEHILPDPISKKVGELGAGVYDSFFRPGKPAEGAHGQESSPDYLLEFLQHGHVEAPEYNNSCKENHPFAKGSLFLSVCVHEMDVNDSEEGDGDIRTRSLRQLYRVDAPLKPRKEVKAEKITAALLSNLGIERIDAHTLERVADTFRLASYHIENPYILIPKVSSSVSVTLTVSQVNVWPRAVVVGQTTQVLKKLLFLHKVAVWHQWLRPGKWSALPELDEGKKLLITMSDTADSRREQRKASITGDPERTGRSLTSASTMSSPSTGRRGRESRDGKEARDGPEGREVREGTGATLPRIDATSSSTPKAHAKLFSKQSNASAADGVGEVHGGVLTWSLLTMTNENQNEGGYLFSVPRGAGERGALVRREVWCVLVDKCFLNYVALDNIKPRLHADLKQCYVAPMADGIFRIDSDQSAPNSFKTLYFMGKNRKEGARWFWKLYTQSASNSIQKYSGLNFQPGGEGAAFAMTRGERDEVGLGTADRGVLEEDELSVRKLSAHRNVSSQLQTLRADPMMAFVYSKEGANWDNTSVKSTSTASSRPVRKKTITRLMKAKKTGFADLITRSKSCAEGFDDSGVEHVWVGLDMSAAIAAAVEAVEAAPVEEFASSDSLDGRRGQGVGVGLRGSADSRRGGGGGKGGVAFDLPSNPAYPCFPSSVSLLGSDAGSIANSLSSTPRGGGGVSILGGSRDGRESKRGKKVKGAGVSKSRLSKFYLLESTV